MLKQVVYTIAGSDSSGGAGIQADLRTFQQLGVQGASVITAITAQNSAHVSQIDYLSPAQIQAQLLAIKDELPAAAIKIGMVGQSAALDCLDHFLKDYRGYVVLDPVLIASSGVRLWDEHTDEYIQKLIQLFPKLDVLTPNIHEAEIISGHTIVDWADIPKAAHKILAMGVKNVVIKGGHLAGECSQDYWTDGLDSFWLSSFSYSPKNYRGTGCTFSSAIAAALALGYTLKDALVIAKMTVNQGIRLSNPLNERAALLGYDHWPVDAADLPYLSLQPLHQLPEPFTDCGSEPLGLYPIVDSSEWLPMLLTAGVKTLQLRIKDKSGFSLEKEIQQSIALANQYQARLFINDYWQLAIKYGAYGVHLGQDDLKTAEISLIHQAGLRLGISTHCYYEVARAHAYRPSYLACGPIFKTSSKVMPFEPQGIKNLARWRSILKNYPLVAIGGINRENIEAVLATGVDGIAMISVITQAAQPDLVTEDLLMITSGRLKIE